MANALYAKGKQNILNGTVDLDTDDVRAILIDTADYTVNTSTHDFLDDVPAAARVATSSALTITVTDGTVDAADFTFSSVTGDQSEAIIIYQHTGTDSTSELIAYYDTFDSGMPVTPNGGDINVTVNASGLFSI